MKINPALLFPQAHQDAMEDFAHSFAASPGAQTFNEIRLDAAHWDGNEAMFTARMLEYIRPGVMEVEFPELKGQLLVPIDTSPSPGASSWTVNQLNQAGATYISTDLEYEIPMADAKMTTSTVPFFSLRNGYSYSQQEARAAIMAGIPLIPYKAMFAREQLTRAFDAILFVGSTTAGGAGGVKGLLNQSSALTYTTPTGAGGSALWDNKSPDEILVDLNGAPNQIVTNSLEVEVPDTMVLPLSARNLIAGRRVGDGTSMNVMQYFLANTAFVQQIIATHKSETIGSGSTRRMCVYKRSNQKLCAPTSVPFEQSAPQVMGLEVRTYCHIRTAGVVLMLPGSMIYADGI